MDTKITSPIFQKDDKWCFWDEVWMDHVGPYHTKEEAEKGLERYVRELNIRDTTAEPIEIEVNGEVKIEPTLYILKRHKDCVAAFINAITKWPKVIAVTGGSDGDVGIALDKENMEDGELSTEISFPSFKGWDIYCQSANRYTITLCFVKG